MDKQEMTMTMGRHESFETENRIRSAEGALRLKMDYPAVVAPGAYRLDPEDPHTAYTLIVQSKGHLVSFAYNPDLEGFDPATMERVNFTELSCALLPRRSGDAFTAGGVVIVPDVATSKAFRKAVSKAASQQGDDRQLLRRLESALEISRSMPASTRFVVLTEALSRKYYLPHRLSETSIRDWVRAFELGRPRSLETMSALVARVYARGEVEDGGLELFQQYDHGRYEAESRDVAGLFARYASLETEMLASPSGRSLQTECRRFSRLSMATDIWTYLTMRDKVRREYHRISGDVFRLEHISGNQYEVMGSTSARDGKRIHFIDERNPSRKSLSMGRTVKRIEVDPSGIVTMVLSGGSGEWSGDYCETPYLPTYTGEAGRKWVVPEGSEDSPKRIRREVPLYVSLAGAPTEGR